MIEDPETQAIAVETLETLTPHSIQLQELSDQAAEAVLSQDLGAPLTNLVDALAIFTDSIKTSRKVLGLYPHGVADHLEKQLLDLLQGVLREREQENLQTLAVILEYDLPHHFEQWRQQGLPALLQSSKSRIASINLTETID